MCTVMALPLDRGAYILAGNRDERLNRARATPPALQPGESRDWLAPVDPDGGGTWTSVNDAGLSLSLLNNYAAQMAEPDEPISRGRLVAALAEATDLKQVRQRLAGWNADLARVRPFVLLAVAPGEDAPAALEAGWDGRELKVSDIALPFWRTSNGADQGRGEQIRGPVFEELARGWPGEPTSQDERLLIAFADHRPRSGRYSLCMHAEPFGATVSHTEIRVKASHAEMRYLAGSPCRGQLGPALVLARKNR